MFSGPYRHSQVLDPLMIWYDGEIEQTHTGRARVIEPCTRTLELPLVMRSGVRSFEFLG